MALIASLATAPAALAQAWPTKQPIKLVAVFPPGGSVDQVARIRAPALIPALPFDTHRDLAGQGIEVRTGTPQTAQAFIEGQIDVWAKVMKDNGIKAD